MNLVINRLSDKAEILFYGQIGYGGILAKDFVTQLTSLEKSFKQIDLRINCTGGDVFEGIAIINAIRKSPANIVGYIDSVAASMGAIIVLSLKESYINKYARLMTHRVQGGCLGDADALQQRAELVRGLDDDLVNIIAIKAKIGKEQARKEYVNGQDKWISANEAVRLGLVNGMFDGDVISQNVNNAFSDIHNSVSKPVDKGFGMEELLFVAWNEIWNQHKTQELKNTNMQLYAFKFNQHFGKYPNDVSLDHSRQQLYEMAVNDIELKSLLVMDFEQLHKSNKLERLRQLSEKDFNAKREEFRKCAQR